MVVTGNITGSQNMLEFIKGGNSTFTLKNIETENRFTYKVEKADNAEVYFVKVLTSPDIYSFIGTIKADNIYHHSPKSKIGTDANSVKVFNWVFEKIKSDTLPSVIHFFHEGKCAKCGRPLTDPDSIVSGFGPICRKTKK